MIKDMPFRLLGHTGISVSALGLGAGPLGDARLSDREAETLVRSAVDLGIALIDTAPSYGSSEARVGRGIRGMRDRVTLVTKGGYGVEGEADWTPRCLTLGVDQALERMQVDTIDVFLLHSCSVDKLRGSDLFAPLEAAKASGKIRAIGYSGDGDALAWAIRSGRVDVIECSVNVFDQSALLTHIPEATARGIGVIAKRAMANAPWTFEVAPSRDDTSIYWRRMLTMVPNALTNKRSVVAPDPPEWGLDDLAVRFAAFAPGVTSALVGTTRIEHIERAVHCVRRGVLGQERSQAIVSAFREHGSSWQGVV